MAAASGLDRGLDMNKKNLVWKVLTISTSGMGIEKGKTV